MTAMLSLSCIAGQATNLEFFNLDNDWSLKQWRVIIWWQPLCKFKQCRETCMTHKRGRIRLTPGLNMFMK